jgi:hypothetical protein
MARQVFRPTGERSDRDDVEAWRFEQALELGCDPAAAERFALSDGDLEQLRQLVRVRGCDPDVAALIVG